MKTPSKSRTYPIDIRFSDLDALGHVNNAIYLNYLEKVRILWLIDEKIIAPKKLNKIPLILARSEIDYKKPISDFKDFFATIFLSHLGTKSFNLSYTIKKKDIIYCEAKTVQVWFNYESNQTIVIPNDIQKKMKLLLT